MMLYPGIYIIYTWYIYIKIYIMLYPGIYIYNIYIYIKTFLSQVHARIEGGGPKSEGAGVLPGAHALGAENGEHVVPRDVRGCHGAAVLLHVARCAHLLFVVGGVVVVPLAFL